MGVLRTQFTWIIFIAENKQTRDRDKDRFYVQFYWLRATTINIGFTNQDPSCRAGSHKSSSVSDDFTALSWARPWVMKSPESSLHTDTIVKEDNECSWGQRWDIMADNVNKSNWDAKWIHTTNVDEWWMSLIGRTLGLKPFAPWWRC